MCCILSVDLWSLRIGTSYRIGQDERFSTVVFIRKSQKSLHEDESVNERARAHTSSFAETRFFQPGFNKMGSTGMKRLNASNFTSNQKYGTKWLVTHISHHTTENAHLGFHCARKISNFNKTKSSKIQQRFGTTILSLHCDVASTRIETKYKEIMMLYILTMTTP